MKRYVLDLWKKQTYDREASIKDYNNTTRKISDITHLDHDTNEENDSTIIFPLWYNGLVRKK